MDSFERGEFGERGARESGLPHGTNSSRILLSPPFEAGLIHFPEARQGLKSLPNSLSRLAYDSTINY